MGGFPDLEAYFAAQDQGHARSIRTNGDSLGVLGDAMRLARIELGFSLSEAARLAGTSREQILRVERGADARLATFLRLAEIYGCRISAHVSFPELGPLWKAANLRRDAERDERMRARRRRAYERRTAQGRPARRL